MSKVNLKQIAKSNKQLSQTLQTGLQELKELKNELVTIAEKTNKQKIEILRYEVLKSVLSKMDLA